MSSKFDIIVYGATGFTGRLIAEYLHQSYGNGNTVKWAMAGRSKAKLEEVRDIIGAPADTPLVVADSSDMESMSYLVAQTKLVISTVGPYQLYGANLVEACANAGTDYVDLCGESVWMRQMIDLHEESAKASGARIVFSCGFDSIPSDLGVYMLQKLAIEKTGSPCTKVSGRVRAMQGTFSGGTLASIKVSFAAAKEDPENYALAIDDYALVPQSQTVGVERVEQPKGEEVVYDETLGTWLAPFIMAAINTRNVHRSNFLLGHEYGTDFVYDEMMMTGPGEKGEETANFIVASTRTTDDDGPKPGEGPSKEERESGFFDILYIGTTNEGSILKVSVKGDRDPGYGSTSKMLSESALCLLQDASELGGGIWTTAPAMGDKLIKRLQTNAGLTFTVE
ncbi:MAG: saccharopine dehydrogenase NADP-binding domain-containing protein [Acidiferrobacterales bacterium]|nr:saccharopine dehydrogenase NADP-binding domain-containing protein [Acidiferrobacterales bacterium]